MTIVPETHETFTYDVKRTHCCTASDISQLAFDLQASQAAAAGYFGGYTSKMQDVGEKELSRMRDSLYRKLETEPKMKIGEQYRCYSKGLLRDLEAKGTIRTVTEAVNLALHANQAAVLQLECIRTFPTVSIPASLLLCAKKSRPVKTPRLP